MSTSSQSIRRSRRRRLGLAFALLGAVLAAQPSPAFADGSQQVAGLAQPERWGASTAAAIGPDSSFKGTDGLSATDAWAVGGTNLSTAGGAVQSTLIEHWDGTRWSVVASPNQGNIPSTGVVDYNTLNAVDAISPNDAWAVGFTGINGFDGSASLIEHWNGEAWSIVPSPNGISPSFKFYNVLQGVSGTSRSDVWAVGWNGFLLDGGMRRPTIQHWNGSTWALNSVPPIGNNAQTVVLQAVTALAPNDA